MERLKSFGYVFIFIYVIVSFFSGLFFHGQSRVKCIEQHGFWMGGIVGCDVIEGNLSPAALPSFLTSQLKGLFWPYHFFFDTKDSERPISINSPSSKYPFEKSVIQQYDAAIEPLEDAQASARCQVLLALAAEGLKQSDESMHSKLMLLSNSSKHMAERMLLINKYSNKGSNTRLSQDMKAEFIAEVMAESQKYNTYYTNLYDDILTGVMDELKQGRKNSESTQKAYQEDLETCIDISSEAPTIPLTELLDILSEPPPQPKIIGDILEQYPYKLSLSEIKSELTDEKFNETVMRCGGILQAFVNGIPNEGTKIPEAGKRSVELSLLALSIHKEILGEASQLSKLEVDDVAAGRVMKEFAKHEESYTPWLKYKNMILNSKRTVEAGFTLGVYDDERQCLELTDGIYNSANQN
jgi:hypothetical protein